MFWQLLCSGLFFSSCLFAVDFIPPNQNVQNSQATQDDIEKKMNDALLRAEQEVERAKSNATRRDIAPTWNTKLELQNAILQLEVKKTLVNNFLGTESLKSKAVRDKLLLILNKPMITTADLADLQSLVLSEKARMKIEAEKSVPAN